MDDKTKRKADPSPDEPTAKLAKTDQESVDGDGKNSAKSFSDFPVEVLATIIKMLPKTQWPILESVDRTIQNGVWSVWQQQRKLRVDEDFLLKTTFPGRALLLLIEKLIVRAPNTTELSGFENLGFKISNPGKILGRLSQFEHLERVDIANYGVYLSDVRQFLEKSAKRGILKELRIDSARGRSLEIDQDLRLEALWCDWASITDSSIQLNVSRLTTLSLATTKIWPENLIDLISGADQLRYLAFHVEFCYQEEWDEMRRLFRQLFHVVVDLAKKNLSYLKITGGDASLYSDLIDLITECGRQGHLKGLSVESESFCGPAIINAISENLRDLTELELNIVNCGTQPLIRLAQRLTKLEKLNLSYWVAYPDRSDDVVVAISTNLTNLTSLRLDATVSINALANLANLVRLKTLRVRCPALDNATSVAWSTSFGPNLESLTLRDYFSKIAAGVIDLIKNSSQLRRLCLETDGLTNDHLRTIAESCPLLEEFVYFRGGTKIIEGLQEIIDRCRFLKWMDNGRFGTSGLKVEKYRKINFRQKRDKTPFGSEKWF